MSGIAAALSNSCAQLIFEVVARRRVPGPLISFDVNHRSALWRPDAARAAQVLLELARSADLVFVGRDEAEALWGIGKVEEIRDLLHGHGADVIVKDAGTGATAFSARQEVFVPAPACRVVERVGAGDAFAAGYLAALLEGRDVRAGLRLGHLVAGATLATRDDVPRSPSAKRSNAASRSTRPRGPSCACRDPPPPPAERRWRPSDHLAPPSAHPSTGVECLLAWLLADRPYTGLGQLAGALRQSASEPAHHDPSQGLETIPLLLNPVEPAGGLQCR